MGFGKIMASICSFLLVLSDPKKTRSVETCRAVEMQGSSNCCIGCRGVCYFSIHQQNLSLNDTSSEFGKMPFFFYQED